MLPTSISGGYRFGFQEMRISGVSMLRNNMMCIKNKLETLKDCINKILY